MGKDNGLRNNVVYKLEYFTEHVNIQEYIRK